uniref:Uncharacterized protein n=1 Tax=Aegilops tauschii subsp. strangulata TaxID=200361 RepID=A0A453EXU8_AEGTS
MQTEEHGLIFHQYMKPTEEHGLRFHQYTKPTCLLTLSFRTVLCSMVKASITRPRPRQASDNSVDVAQPRPESSTD